LNFFFQTSKGIYLEFINIKYLSLIIGIINVKYSLNVPLKQFYLIISTFKHIIKIHLNISPIELILLHQIEFEIGNMYVVCWKCKISYLWILIIKVKEKKVCCVSTSKLSKYKQRLFQKHLKFCYIYSII
jgi:hypothetical protein